MFRYYNLSAGVGPSSGDALEQESAVVDDETEFRFGRTGASVPIVRVDRETCAPDARVNGDRPLSMDEDVQPHERDLRALMIAGLDGDAQAYHALLKRLTAHLRAYYRNRFAQLGHGPTEAEDLLQEVLLAIHTHRDTYDRRQPFTPWLHAIARYKFLDYLRRTRSSFRHLPLESVEEVVAGSDLAATESGLDLQRLMLKISAKARQVIQYVKVEGMTVSEAAKRCRMSESAVKVTIHRGLKALAIQIRRESGA